MYNYNELNAVSLSPTKKDYYQIWNELIEVSSKLSSRWDPSATNESDPGIVLLKVLTAIADKLNYNIDANTLEAFMPSAAQESSMRKLCEMLGYEMRYYQSASTNVRITFNGTSFPALGSSGTKAIYIDRFTNIQDAESTINYITLEPVTLTSYVRSATVECLEGELVAVQTDAGNIITLTHLDDNYRFYLPERQIASNGIFITNVGKDSFWTQTSNLNTSLLGSTVYKFGYDSIKGLPYIQFPDDIGSLIGTGLSIYFVRTRGVSGNVSSGFLKTMSEPASWSYIKETSTSEVSGEDIVGDAAAEASDDWSDLEQYSITNLAAAKNGKNPETIDEAYWNYQKQVGTFETLVTCRDYMNKIYQMTKSYVDTNPLVSNIIVSDIRDDINKAYTLTSFSEQGLEMERLSKIGDQGEKKIEYFDLVLYPFQATLGQTQKDFEDSFKYTNTPIATITAGLDSNKTIAHRFRNPDPTDIACIKIYFQISARLTTTSKISYLESIEVQQAAHQALYKEFNLRNLSFGDELPFDTILQVLTLADPRIKNVTLDDPKMTMAVCTVDGEEYPIITNEVFSSFSEANKSKEFYKQLVLDNVMAGRVALLNEQATFKTSLQELKYPESKSKISTTASRLQTTESLLPLAFNNNTKNLSLKLSLEELLVDGTANNKLKTFITTRPGTFCCRLIRDPESQVEIDGEKVWPEINYQNFYTAISALKIKLFAPGQADAKYTLNFQPYRRDANYTAYDYFRSFLSYIDEDTGAEYIDEKDTEIISKTGFIMYPSSESADLRLATRDFMLCQVPLNSTTDEAFDKVTLQFIPVSAFYSDAAIKNALSQIALVVDFYESYETCSPSDGYTSIDLGSYESNSIIYGTTAPNYQEASYSTELTDIPAEEGPVGSLSADLYWPGINPTYSTSITPIPTFVEDKSLSTYKFEIANENCQLNQTWRLGFKAIGKSAADDVSEQACLVLTRNTADSSWIRLSNSFNFKDNESAISSGLFSFKQTNANALNEDPTYSLSCRWCKEGKSYQVIGATKEPAIAKVYFMESANEANLYRAPGLRITFTEEAIQAIEIPLNDLAFMGGGYNADKGYYLLSIGPFVSIKLFVTSSSSVLSLAVDSSEYDGSAILGWITTPGLLAPAWVYTAEVANTSDTSETRAVCGNAYLRGKLGGKLIGLPKFTLAASGLQSAYILNHTNSDLNISLDEQTSVAYAPEIVVPTQLDLTQPVTNIDAVGNPSALTMAQVQAAIANCSILDEASGTLVPLSSCTEFQPAANTPEGTAPVSKILELSAPTKITSDFKVYTDHISKDDPLVLAQNEVIQFRSPNFKTTATYPAYVNYYVHLSDTQASGARAAAVKKGNAAVPATMQSMIEFFEGGPAYIGQTEYNAYPLCEATSSQSYANGLKQPEESSWNRKISWEEKINSMPTELLCSETLEYAEDKVSAAEEMQAKYDKLVEQHGAVFTKDIITLRETPEGEETWQDSAKGIMEQKSGSMPKYQLFEPISKYVMPKKLTLTYVSITQENFETWLRWLRGSVGSDANTKITYREDVEAVVARAEPAIIGTGKQLITGIYKRAAASTKRNIGYLVDENKFKFAELTGLGGKALKDLYVPRLWRVATFTHTADGLGIDATSVGISANTEYQLKSDEYILISYSTSEGRDDGTTVVKNIVIPGNAIVKANFDLVDSAVKSLESSFPKTSGFGPWVKPGTKEIITPAAIDGMFTLGATEQIEVREPIEVKLDEAITNLYWEVKDPVIQGSIEKFPFDQDGTYILQPGEYLFYTNEAKESFVYYGSGAEIRRSPKTPSIERPVSLSKMSMDEISSSGLVASMPWVPFNLSAANAAISVSEYQIINLVEKDALLNVSWLPEEQNTVLSNKFRRIQSADYSVQGNEGTLPSLAIDSHYWEARGKLELNMSQTTPQVLVAHQSLSGQEQARSFINIYKNITSASGANTTVEQVVQTYTALPSLAPSKPVNPNSLDLGGAPDTYADGQLPTNLSKAVRDGEGLPATTLLLYASTPLVGADGDLRFVDGLECPVFKACTATENTYSNETPFAPVFTDSFVTLDLLGHLSDFTIVKDDAADKDQPGNVTEAELHELELTRPALSLSTLIPDSNYFGILPILYIKPDEQHFAEICVRNTSNSPQALSIFNYTSGNPSTIYDASKAQIRDKYLWTWWPETATTAGHYPLRSGLNLVVIKDPGTLDLFVNKSRSLSNRQDLIRIGELRILAWDNMLNPQLAFESHNLSLEDTYDTRLKFKYKDVNNQVQTLTVPDHEALAYIKAQDPGNKFYYTYQPAQENGLDLNALDPTDTMALPKAWFDSQNLANKFVISALDTAYLTEYVDVSKFSKQGASL